MDGDEFKFQDPNNEEEEEETLSLCDLPLYSDHASESDKYENSNGHDRFSKDEQSWSSMDRQTDLFEFSFSSEEFSSSRHYGDSIIFCGKLITCKEPPVIAKKQHEIPSKNKKKKNNKKTTNNNHHKEKRRFFRWRLHIFTRSRTRSNKLKVKAKSKSKSHTDESDRVTAMKCRAKCRWYFFMLGSARFPLEMELHDIKSRQDRRCPSSFMFRSSNGDGKVNEKQRNWGLWRLLKTLSCIGSYSNANALVNSSYGCIVRE